MKQDWSDIYIIVGDRIRKLRESKKMTLDVLAARCGLASRQSLFSIEKGKQAITIHQAWAIAIALETEPQALFGFEGTESVAKLKQDIYERRVKELREELGL